MPVTEALNPGRNPNASRVDVAEHRVAVCRPRRRRSRGVERDLERVAAARERGRDLEVEVGPAQDRVDVGRVPGAGRLCRRPARRPTGDRARCRRGGAGARRGCAGSIATRKRVRVASIPAASTSTSLSSPRNAERSMRSTRPSATNACAASEAGSPMAMRSLSIRLGCVDRVVEDQARHARPGRRRSARARWRAGCGSRTGSRRRGRAGRRCAD